MSHTLVIVESPMKARTIEKYLGDGYEVAASVGHVRDLPKKELGVDVEHGFKPKYVTTQPSVVRDLKKKASAGGITRVILATDPDREGEAIAYHVAERLGYENDKDRFQRVTFHEITKEAVQEALDNPGPLDTNKIEAQQARRILDRLVGYQVSPMLWEPIRRGLSAGRVQTVTLRLICEREDEIRAFVEQEYWSITAHLIKDGQKFEAKLHQIDGRKFKLSTEDAAADVVGELNGIPFVVSSVKRRERRKNPAPPFTTSTLQQEAAKRLGFSARATMSTAQKLYEGKEIGGRGQIGLITYMRTDSNRVSPGSTNQAREWITREFGASYIPKSPRLYSGKKQRAAQDAHEAVRPTDPMLHPSEARSYLAEGEAKLYELIWLRFVASQMSPAVYDTTTVDFELGSASGRDYLFRSTGSIVKFQGFTRLYLETRESGEHRRLDDLEPLPELAPEDLSETEQIEQKQHFTQPPPRFSEASLVKELEKLGIGRPSTYADTIGKIRDRDYVELEKKRFHPTDLGEVVTKLLVRILPNIFDVEFTSRMENELDRVEDGEVKWHGLLADFYPGFRERLEDGQENSDQIIKEILAAEGETCEQCGQPMLVKWTKSGRFLGCSAYPECKGKRSMDGIPPEGIELGLHPAEGRQVRLKTGRYGPFLELEAPEEGKKPKRVSLPEKMSPSEVDLEDAVKLLDAISAEGIELGLHPEEERTVRVKDGPYGPYVELEAPEEGKKPKRVSLPEKMSSSEVDLEYAIKLLELPRTVGEDPNTGEEIVAGLGRYGPFVRRGKTFANLKSFDAMWTVTLEEALGLIDAKASGKPQALKELGEHPDTGQELFIYSGRWGPYIKHEKVNAGLPKGMEVDEVTLEMAIDLLEKKKASRGKKKGRGRSKK